MAQAKPPANPPDKAVSLPTPQTLQLPEKPTSSHSWRKTMRRLLHCHHQGRRRLRPGSSVTCTRVSRGSGPAGRVLQVLQTCTDTSPALREHAQQSSHQTRYTQLTWPPASCLWSSAYMAGACKTQSVLMCTLALTCRCACSSNQSRLRGRAWRSNEPYLGCHLKSLLVDFTVGVLGSRPVSIASPQQHHLSGLRCSRAPHVGLSGSSPLPFEKRSRRSSHHWIGTPVHTRHAVLMQS